MGSSTIRWLGFFHGFETIQMNFFGPHTVFHLYYHFSCYPIGASNMTKFSPLCLQAKEKGLPSIFRRCYIFLYNIPTPEGVSKQ